MRKSTILALFVLLISMEAYSKDYHVSKSGNDLNSGTLSQPFTTITMAAKIALPGDVITVHHTGEVYLNGKSLYEIDSLSKVKAPKPLKDAVDVMGSTFQWTELKVKHGTQREREVIFNALAIGWSKENIGSHIVRNNVIFNCEQTGICGHLGAVFSTISHNHIYNINVKRQFSGAEIGGIKLHAAIDFLIKDNRIHDCFRCLWLDWQAQGATVSGNLFCRNATEDIFIEVCHGPHIVDNNLFLSETSLRNFAQDGAFFHNLFAGKVLHAQVLNHFTPYHFPHLTSVAGLMTILGGDDRFFNNIFIGRESSEMKQQKSEIAESYGLEAYDDYPIQSDDWLTGRTVDDYAKIRMPVFIRSNLYLRGARPYKKEINAKINARLRPEISLEENENEVILHFEADATYIDIAYKMITTERLGYAFQSEAPFENFDGTSMKFTTDYFGAERNLANPVVGPFGKISNGRNTITIWNKK